jgi:hypothetical protein
MVVLILVLIVLALFSLTVIEITTALKIGSILSDQDISDYLDKIENQNLIQGVTTKWNDKLKLDLKGYRDNPSIDQTKNSLIFPYYVYNVGVVPIWSKSYKRIKNIFDEQTKLSKHQSKIREKLGLD